MDCHIESKASGGIQQGGEGCQFPIPQQVQNMKGFSVIPMGQENILLCFNEKFLYFSSQHIKGGKVQTYLMSNLKKIVPVYFNYILMLKQNGQIGIFQVRVTSLTRMQLFPIKDFIKAQSFFLREVQQQFYEVQVFFTNNDFCAYQFSKEGHIGFLSFSVDEQDNISKQKDMSLYGTRQFYLPSRRQIVCIQDDMKVKRTKIEFRQQDRTNYVIGSLQQKYLNISITKEGQYFIRSVFSEPSNQIKLPFKFKQQEFIEFYHQFMVRNASQALLFKVVNLTGIYLTAILQGLSDSNSWITPFKIASLKFDRQKNIYTKTIQVRNFRGVPVPAQISNKGNSETTVNNLQTNLSAKINNKFGKDTQSFIQSSLNRGNASFKPSKIIGRKKTNLSKQIVAGRNNLLNCVMPNQLAEQLKQQQKQPTQAQPKSNPLPKQSQCKEVQKNKEENLYEITEVEKKTSKALCSDTEKLIDSIKNNEDYEEKLVEIKIQSQSICNEVSKPALSLVFNEECKLPPKIERPDDVFFQRKQTQNIVKSQEKQQINECSNTLVQSEKLSDAKEQNLQEERVHQKIKRLNRTNRKSFDHNLKCLDDCLKDINSSAQNLLKKVPSLVSEQELCKKEARNFIHNEIVEKPKGQVLDFIIEECLDEVQNNFKSVFNIEQSFYSEATRQLQVNTHKHNKMTTSLKDKRKEYIKTYQECARELILYDAKNFSEDCQFHMQVNYFAEKVFLDAKDSLDKACSFLQTEVLIKQRQHTNLNKINQGIKSLKGKAKILTDKMKLRQAKNREEIGLKK